MRDGEASDVLGHFEILLSNVECSRACAGAMARESKVLEAVVMIATELGW